MTNNWSDIGNSSLVVVMGANPSENHPACMAHINAARANGGKLIVIDPRKTRTAVQADRYIRQRPGTDIAFINGVVRGVIAEMEDTTDGLSWIPAADRAGVRTKFFAFLNEGGGRPFFSDGDATGASTTHTMANFSKYTDARLIVNGAGSDYERQTYGSGPTGVSNFPKYAATIDGDPDTVYNWMKAHVDPYDDATVSSICGTTGGAGGDLEYVIRAYIDNSRCSSVGAYTGAGSQDPRVAGYKCTTMLYAMGLTQHTCGGQNVKSFAMLQTLLGNVGRAGGGINALRGIHNVQGSTDMGNLQHLIPFYSGNPSAMSYVDASGVPDATRNSANYKNSFGKYMDMLWGKPVNGTATRGKMDMSYDDAYNRTFQVSTISLQQWGFLNMTYNFFGGGNGWIVDPAAVDRTMTDALYDLWPKGNGHDHITMFREAAAGNTKAMVVWGQNPAVTEPNQKWIREGFYNLETLVVTDLFETETAAVSRKGTGVTYLLPTCSHVEEAGSVSNSGRVLQWRERVSKPFGNSRSDMELLFRFAYALNGAGAFSHITAMWNSAAVGKGVLDAYDVLYGGRYGWSPADATAFEDLSVTTEVWRGAETAPKSATVWGSEVICEQMFAELCTAGTGTSWLYVDAYNAQLDMSLLTATRLPTAIPAIAWQVKNRAKSRDTRDPIETLAYPAWGYAWLVNRRVLYNNGDIPGDQGDGYQRPEGLAALFTTTQTQIGRFLNYSGAYRFYHRLGDKPDVAGTGTKHVLPGPFPAHTEPYETLRSDLLAAFGRNTRNNTTYGSAVAGQKWNLVKSDTTVYVPTPGEVDMPYRTNTTPAGITTAAGSTGFAAIAEPLVMTSIRCVEHFQGGPITRNNPWNVEAEPVPWVEISSFDAAARGIKDGDKINIHTVRSDSLETGWTAAHKATRMADSNESGTWNEGYVARVGVGLESNQRVGRGVVAIPWHWGDKGLSTGARANDLCIDAGDANTTIPEYKACVCWITKA